MKKLTKKQAEAVVDLLMHAIGEVLTQYNIKNEDLAKIGNSYLQALLTIKNIK